MKKSIILFFVALLVPFAVFAEEHNFTEAKRLIDSGISCDKLTDGQLEEMGDYYMGQMHPGEQHELMDKMMGGEGSESLKQMHIQMAKRIYCNEDVGGMMGMMGSGGMMGAGGMMGGKYASSYMGKGMMGYGSYGYGYWSFVNILLVILLIGLIILVYLWIVKLLQKQKKK